MGSRQLDPVTRTVIVNTNVTAYLPAEGNGSYLVRWNRACDEHPCRVCDADCPYREAWLDQLDL